MKDASLWYAKHGVAVFPLYWPTEGGCSCGKPDCHSPGKHPLTPHGFKDATTNQADTSEWWSKWPAGNIGMPTGGTPALLVVDVDPRHGGNESLDELLAKHGAFPDTAYQLTGGDGLHIFLHYPDGAVPKTLAPGIDSKGDGGYIFRGPNHWRRGTRPKCNSRVAATKRIRRARRLHVRRVIAKLTLSRRMALACDLWRAEQILDLSKQDPREAFAEYDTEEAA